MPTLNELYDYYCQRCGCVPNSMFSTFLMEEYARQQDTCVLEEVDVSNNYLGKKGIIPVLDLVKNVKTVVSLDVSNNLLEHEQLDHLVYCLILHPRIERVVLRDNCLHDGSINHILELLELNTSIIHLDLDGNDFLPTSLALIEDLLSRNRTLKAKLLKEAIELDSIRAANCAKAPQATVTGQLVEKSSGGHFHYASWWRNPQYCISISRTSTVSIEMNIADGIPARQAGFAVMRYDGVRRVIEVGPKTVVAESDVDHQRCTLEVSLGEAGLYVVMPFTFHPGRSMCYTINASLVNAAPTLDAGWVRLELLNERYDWFMTPLESCWSTANAGGAAGLHTWRLNDMYRLRYRTSDSLPESSHGTVCVILYKDVDPDNNDEKEIGLDVVEHDLYGKQKPPVVCASEQVRFRVPHERKTRLFLKMSVRVSELDFFVVPSTKSAGQHGRYTLVVFSTLPLDVEVSRFPHGWCHRTLTGRWDEQRCGGSREAYLSWKNNPAVELVMDGAKPVIACLEVSGVAPPSLSTALVPRDNSEKGEEEEEDAPMTAADIAVVQRLTEEKAFLHRHKAGAMEVCVTAVDGLPPKYAVRRTSKLSSVESAMTLVDTSAPFYLVLTARHAGQLGEYKLHLFCEDHFVIGSVEALSLRERQWQLDTYAQENRVRVATQQGHREQRLSNGPGSSAELIELARTRDTILRRYLSTSEEFSDRDFPRGTSSLFLDPEAKVPLSFPAEYVWKRVVDINTAARCAEFGAVSPPFPYNKRHHFASIVHALCAKPSWLSRVVVGYDRDAGFAQFRFYVSDRWIGVTVDDYLPVDSAGALCFGHSVDPSDFTYALAEKAFAKLHRCYEALEPQVVPELSLMDVLVQGMMDVSGGFATVHAIRGADGVELTTSQRDALWRMMKEATKSTTLLTLILRSLGNISSERKSAGILPDRLYGVMDARFVERQRLVKLLNWSDSADTQWKGKFAPHGKGWTDTLLDVLEYNHTHDVIWMTFDEVLYFFTDAIATEEPSRLTRIAGDFTTSESDRLGPTADILPHPQFSLEVWDLPLENDPVAITIGLHQRDARKSITRDKHATARYRNALGMAVVATDDNQRCLVNVEDKQVVGLVRPARGRDLFCTVYVNPRNISKERLTIMPIKDHESDPNVTYFVSARSADVQLELAPVDRAVTMRVSGSWGETTAGGPPSCPVWRDNQQFLLFPSEQMEVSICLARNGGLPGACSIGFTVHNTRRCCSFLQYDPATVVLDVAAEAKPSVGATVTLQGMRARRGMPYIIVPHCGSQGDRGDFIIEVVSNRKVSLTTIEPRLDWHRLRRTVSVSVADGSAGGSARFPSWRCSPQLFLDFPVAREGRVFIAATNCNRNDERNEIGMMLLRADTRWERGQRRRLTYAAEDVVAMTGDTVGRVELDVELSTSESLEPLILVVYATMPYKEVDIEVSFYSAAPLEATPVTEWKCTAIEQGCWELGQTAGGSRAQFASWVNNPLFGLSVIRRTNVVALLIQYPYSPEKPAAKRFGDRKLFLPPPITNPESRMSIELDLVQYDEQLSPIVSVGPTKNAEVVLETHLEPCGDRPYLLVPCTTIPEKNGDFKLLIYADQPVDIYSVEKPRLYYV